MAGRVTTQLIIEGKNTSNKAFAEVDKNLSKLNSKVSKVGEAIAAYLSFEALRSSVSAISEAADSVQLMNARLRLATGSQEEYNTATAELGRIALATASPVSALVELYGKISRPLKQAGRSQQDILKVTEAVALSFRVSGASAEEAENGIQQFAQALGSGVLRGDEFNSVAEQAPRLMQALADALGVPTTALRGLAEQGALTAEVVSKALIDQVGKLKDEAATLPDTVGAAMTRLQDALTKALGQTDTQPLIESIDRLRATLSDPEVSKNIVTLASSLLEVAAAAARAGSEFVQLAKEAGYFAAEASGQVDELTRLEKLLDGLKAARNGGSFIGRPVASLFMSNDQLDEWIKEVEDKITATRANIMGISVDAQRAADKALEDARRSEDEQRQAAAEIHAARVSESAEYRSQVKSIYDGLAKDAATAVKAQTKAEQDGVTALAKIRQDRLAIEKRYKDALAGFNGVGEEDSFGAATALKVKAKDALRSGDLESAKQNAQDALQMLQDLQKAGANTYGFSGVAKELKDIELAANDAEAGKVTDGLEKSRQKVAEIQAALDAMKNVNITLNLSDEEVAKITTQIQALAQALGKELFIPVQVQAPAEMSAPAVPDTQVTWPTTSGYATGTQSAEPGVHWVGENGPELLAFNGGEKVFTAARSRALAARLEGMQLPSLATSPMVDASFAGGGGGDRSLGHVAAYFGNERYDLLAEESTFKKLHRTALQRGSRRQRTS
ncbi:Phage-related minor tail protein [Pseudomonas knackmussii B13]|uniref:Phage-related minor tail protein n=1 Tax=Pseudomonas knackmussii (strain DSM 6978 / CCUG 54928 / LMG 23759 / B13) TaxID=1301098 RepID=A0A024HDT5_PSEKB|nr:tape measure protein [Pseudomonas knackmussii]CDF82652.1 Phage-related minor tail protein [Pseudomonas knackmussii B13]